MDNSTSFEFIETVTSFELNDTFEFTENSSSLLDNITLDDGICRLGSTPIADFGLFLQRLLSIYADDRYGKNYRIYMPVSFAIGCLGIVTSFFNVVVFTRRSMMSSTNFLLAVFSSSEILFVLKELPIWALYFSGFSFMFDYYWNQIYITLTFVQHFSTSFTNWLVVVIGVWRFIAIRWPLKASHLCSMYRAKRVVMLTALISIIISLPVYGLLKLSVSEICSVKFYRMDHSKFFTENPKLKEAYWALLSIVFVVPSPVLLVLTSLLIHSLLAYRRQRKAAFANGKSSTNSRTQDSNDYKITAMLSVLLISFLLSNLPDSAVLLAASISHGDSKAHRASRDATDIIRIFSALNVCVSFFIYYFMNAAFRSTFMQVFCGKTDTARHSSKASNATLSSIQSESVQSVQDCGKVEVQLATMKDN